MTNLHSLLIFRNAFGMKSAPFGRAAQNVSNGRQRCNGPLTELLTVNGSLSQLLTANGQTSLGPECTWPFDLFPWVAASSLLSALVLDDHFTVSRCTRRDLLAPCAFFTHDFSSAARPSP